MLAKDGAFHARMEHIDIWYHFIRFAVDNGSLHLLYCPTEDMIANTLTKALPSVKAKHFAAALGLRVKQPNKPVYRALGNPTRGKVTSQK